MLKFNVDVKPYIKLYMARHMSSENPERDEKGRLLPGHTVNKGGKPQQKELAAACRAMSQEALDVLQEVMTDPNARNMDKIKAATAVLDRGFGKPKTDDSGDDSEKEAARYTVIEIPAQSTQTQDE